MGQELLDTIGERSCWRGENFESMPLGFPIPFFLPLVFQLAD